MRCRKCPFNHPARQPLAELSGGITLTSSGGKSLLEQVPPDSSHNTGDSMAGHIKQHRAMELSEIAVALGISIATAKSIEDRAMKKLAKSKVLEECWAYSGERKSNNLGTES
jgi:hypothetical protein